MENNERIQKMWQQKEIILPKYPRGYHLITEHIENALYEMDPIKIGILHVFICHTSASLTINENADSTVRSDFETHMNALCPENAPYYKHNYEGEDDMPAHIKASLLGSSASVPVRDHSICTGTWQGFYLCEHRNNGESRRLILTLMGN